MIFLNLVTIAKEISYGRLHFVAVFQSKELRKAGKKTKVFSPSKIYDKKLSFVQSQQWKH